MNEEIVVKNLRDITRIFDKNAISYWLDSGTLLGAVRDGRLIEWDGDVDLGVWDDDVPRIIFIFPEFNRKGFDIAINRKMAVMDITRFNQRINACLYHKRGDYAWTVWIKRKRKWIEKVADRLKNISNARAFIRQKGSFVKKIKNIMFLLPSTLKQLLTFIAWLIYRRFSYFLPIVIPRHYFEKLSTIRFYGIWLKIPSDAEKYLEYRYGSDWKTPKRQWIYYKDDGAINLDWRV